MISSELALLNFQHVYVLCVYSFSLNGVFFLSASTFSVFGWLLFLLRVPFLNVFFHIARNEHILDSGRAGSVACASGLSTSFEEVRPTS